MTPEHVAICIHGLARTGASMWPIAVTLQRRGWSQVRCPTIPHGLRPLEWQVAQIQLMARRLAGQHPGAVIDLVTHSMGGLVARGVLHADLPWGRAVLWVPPNRGAQRARQWRRILRTDGWARDPLVELDPDHEHTRPRPPPYVDIGIIAGGRGDGLGYARTLDGDNDGTVRLEETLLDEAKEWVQIRAHHTVMPVTPLAHRLTLRFLQDGTFDWPPVDQETERR